MRLVQLSLFFFLWTGFSLYFLKFGKMRLLKELYRKTRAGMEEAVRKRLLTSREKLAGLQEEGGMYFSIERQLVYSGLKRRFPFLEAENFVLLAVLMCVGIFLLVGFFFGMIWGCAAVFAFCAFGSLIILLGKASEMRSVNGNLLKLLDFLGNYSVTAGEIIGIFGQISKYMEEPIRSVLEQCSVEAQTTGDVGMALLSMADKIEHPQFKELVRNIEVSSRYSADFSVLVSFSRRSMREYLKNGRERKNLLREAGINLILLLGMSLFALFAVDGLLEVSVWVILFTTWPGRIALMVIGCILLLFAGQIYRLEG